MKSIQKILKLKHQYQQLQKQNHDKVSIHYPYNTSFAKNFDPKGPKFLGAQNTNWSQTISNKNRIKETQIKEL